MTDSAFQFIIERIINNALDSVKEAKDNPGEEFYLGRKMAHYEILDIIKNELEIRDEELGEFGLDFNLEEVFL
ncbi:MAG: transposase [Oscillospiraceae bacterium]|nr:transposase [Oscillospiraceae bacterium]